MTMTTLIIMLAVMTAPYVAVQTLAAAKRKDFDGRGAAAVGLSLLFILTGSGHFMLTEPMAQMLPPWAPARVPLVYLTGVLELGIAAGFLVPRLRRVTGRITVVILIVFLAVNIYAAINHVPFGGHELGTVYLFIRVPVQLAILLWVYWFAIKH